MKTLILALLFSTTTFAVEQAKTVKLKEISASITVLIDRDNDVVCYFANRGTWSSDGNAISCVKMDKPKKKKGE